MWSYWTGDLLRRAVSRVISRAGGPGLRSVLHSRRISTHGATPGTGTTGKFCCRTSDRESMPMSIAPNQFGPHAPGFTTYGRSMIIDPWGAVLATAADGEGIAVAEIDLSRVTQVRERLPALTHRRLILRPAIRTRDRGIKCRPGSFSAVSCAQSRTCVAVHILLSDGRHQLRDCFACTMAHRILQSHARRSLRRRIAA